MVDQIAGETHRVGSGGEGAIDRSPASTDTEPVRHVGADDPGRAGVFGAAVGAGLSAHHMVAVRR